MSADPMRARTEVTRPILLVGVVAALLLTACTGDEPVAGDPTTSQAPAPSAGGSSAPADTTSPPPEPVLTLAGAPFSGYVDVRQEVVAWRLVCSEALVMVPDAVTMGTAQKELLPDEVAFVVRQVAVFASADAASAAADELGTYASEQCPDESLMSTTEVEDLDVGTQGLVVDTTAEDGASTTALMRRGNAVALVQAVAAPEYPSGRSPADDARAGARDVFEQLCGYDQAGC